MDIASSRYERFEVCEACIKGFDNYVNNCEIPKFPISGDSLKEHGYETGKILAASVTGIRGQPLMCESLSANQGSRPPAPRQTSSRTSPRRGSGNFKKEYSGDEHSREESLS